MGRFSEVTSSDRIYVNGLNLQESKSEILLDYKGIFELNRSMFNGPFEHKPNFRYRIMDDFESYIFARDIDCASEDVTFTGYV